MTRYVRSPFIERVQFILSIYSIYFNYSYIYIYIYIIIYEIKYKTNVVTQSFMPEFTDNLRTTKVLLTKFDRLVNRTLVVRRLSVNSGMKL